MNDLEKELLDTKLCLKALVPLVVAPIHKDTLAICVDSLCDPKRTVLSRLEEMVKVARWYHAATPVCERYTPHQKKFAKALNYWFIKDSHAILAGGENDASKVNAASFLAGIADSIGGFALHQTPIGESASRVWAMSITRLCNLGKGDQARTMVALSLVDRPFMNRAHRQKVAEVAAALG